MYLVPGFPTLNKELYTFLSSLRVFNKHLTVKQAEAKESRRIHYIDFNKYINVHNSLNQSLVIYKSLSNFQIKSYLTTM